MSYPAKPIQTDLTPQLISLGDGVMAEAIACDNGMVALDVLKPRGKWKPILNMTPDEARKLATCLMTAADRVSLTVA